MGFRLIDLKTGVKIALIMALMLAITAGASAISLRNIGLIEDAEAWTVHTQCAGRPARNRWWKSVTMKV